MNIENTYEYRVAIDSIKIIKHTLPDNTIKQQEIEPIILDDDKFIIGFRVTLKLSTSYDYDNQMLESWRRMIGADCYYINVNKNRLFVHFLVYYSKQQ